MMYQAIVTTFHGPTNHRQSRIKAEAAAGSLWHSKEYGPKDEHDDAARKLAQKYGWKGAWFKGGMPDGKSNVYVCVDNGTGPAAFVVV